MTHISPKPGMRIVFQGDSITDAGRTGSPSPADSLGGGYVAAIARKIAERFPEAGMTVINRGISGNRVYDLENRWTEDCIALEPDLVSVLIGVNDTWRRYDSDILSPTAKFDASLRRILDRVKAETGAQLVLLEPFVLPVPEDRATWREDLDPRIHAVRAIARDDKALFLPLDGMFAQAATQEEMGYWLPDGVHPSAAGHELVAQAWMELVFGR
jgi:acyl-CoA thioesterase I